MTRLTVMCLSFIVVSLMFFGIGNAKIDPKSIAGVRTGLLRKHSARDVFWRKLCLTFRIDTSFSLRVVHCNINSVASSP